MWIFTTGGFISAVSHRDDATKTMIRARDRMSLDEFLNSIRHGFVEAGKTEAEAVELTVPGKDGMWEVYAVHGDYKWRVVVPKTALGLGLAYEAVHYVNYSNFKSKLTATRGNKWHDVAMKVWSAMFGIEDHGVKTGNPDVDNPKPYSYYHGEWIGSSFGSKEKTYPAPKGKSGLPKSSGKGSQTEGTASGSEDDWMDDAVAQGYYDSKWEDANEHSWYEANSNMEVDEGRSYRWGGNGLFQEDLEGYEDPDEAAWREGLHSFSGGTAILDSELIDGRADVIDGELVGSTFLDGDTSDTPSDAELAAVEEAIELAWEPWDEENEYNTITGETRKKASGERTGQLFDDGYKYASSIHSMTDKQWQDMQLAEGYKESL